jgi:hypothetical protein
MLSCRLTVIALLWQHVSSFIAQEPRLFNKRAPGATTTGVFDGPSMALSKTASNNNESSDSQPPFGSILDRRQAIATSAYSFLLGSVFSNKEPAVAGETSSTSIGSSPGNPIVVLGGGGKTGKLCTQILSDMGLYVRSTTRLGRQVLDKESSFVTYASCDVTEDVSLKEALAGASGVIFAASASGKKNGGEPADVDYVGAYKTAKTCIEERVPKMVLISAGAATRPDSAGFKATNLFVKVCGFKEQ